MCLPNIHVFFLLNTYLYNAQLCMIYVGLPTFVIIVSYLLTGDKRHKKHSVILPTFVIVVSHDIIPFKSLKEISYLCNTQTEKL